MPSDVTPKPLSGAYRAVWRWHFYAGLIVLPVLMLMALTGALYLFHDEIDGLAYRSMSQVEAGSGTVSPDRWVAAAEAGTGGRVSNVLIPARPDQAVRLTVDLPDGSQRTAFVDPHDAQLTGVTPFGGVMETVKQLHSLALVGDWANYVVEIVAGWALILVATGVFMWWPRGRDVGVVTVRARDAGRRPFWRDLHAVTGLYAGAVIAFLVVTGMPWSAFWGGQYMAYVKDHGLGRPKPPAAASPFAHAGHGDAPAGVGWTMEGMVMPNSHEGPHASGAARLSVVVAAAEREGLVRPWLVSIPRSPDLAWTAARVIKRVEDTRSVYIDGATGAVRADIRWRSFGVGAKAFEWGIAVHQGTQYGWINRSLMLGGCIAVWLLAISGLVMWWKRRPARRLGAPTAPPGPRVRAAVLGIVLPLAILYPLTGLSLIAALILDRLFQSLRRRAVVAS